MFLKCLLAVLVTSLVSAERLPGPEERIIGGNHMVIEEAPYHVGILEYGVHKCGGAIYSERIVLTAAHCLNASNAEIYSVRAGSSFPNFGGQVVDVQEAYRHEDFKYTTIKNVTLVANDIAVLLLKDRINLNTQRTRSIQLAKKNPATGTECRVTGWGDTIFGSNLGAPRLLGARLNISDYKLCRTKYFTKLLGVTKGMICAYTPGKDSCNFDSGGPLVSLPDLKLIGIVSWGYKCAEPDFPGIYTSVFSFRDWIKNTISKIQKNTIHN
ncbi:trypsin beta-like [Drosophila kikkawai]|uniref:trypsin n=1 Tax=Drosophila kikkawai TaxID=30033 RepID=A0A6P4IHS9_DROKI|nr:trypsin beta-like [Drosophila kikkawai]